MSAQAEGSTCAAGSAPERRRMQGDDELRRTPAGRLLSWWAGMPSVVRWAAVVAGMAALWWSSAQPHVPAPAPWWRSLLHNAAHPLAYGGLAVLALLAIAGAARWERRHAVAAVLIAFGYGAIDELHQAQVAGRASSLADLLADGAGAASAVGIACALQGQRWLWRRLVPACAVLAAGAVALATWTRW